MEKLQKYEYHKNINKKDWIALTNYINIKGKPGKV
jgi:hypothetical protein